MIIQGDCLSVLKTLSDNSVDSCVTDPPYGLSFMGKRWDYDVPSEEVWRECLRVLKPGGYLLSFAGTRTQHRMAVRIEDAGFEIRDMIAWVYGSGFPKSLDIGKALDKKRVGDKFWELRAYLRDCVKSSDLTQKEIKKHLGYPEDSGVIGHWIGNSQPCTPSGKDWKKMKEILPIDERYDNLILEAEREVIGKGKAGFHEKNGVFEADKEGYGDYDLTTPSTDQAKQWEGWGTALKPALEPITVARKPLIGTVAENILTHGTGGLNIDGSRVEGTEVVTTHSNGKGNTGDKGIYGHYEKVETGNARTGRWPANLIHDGSEEVLECFPVSKSTANTRFNSRELEKNTMAGKMHREGGFQTSGYADEGSAARFFYCPKASKKDRDEGLEGMEKKRVSKLQGADNDKENLDPVSERFRTQPSANNHPTVKPTALMRYLVKLVTPPGGTVLDPFAGSGSTGKAAKLEGFEFIGIEKEKEYVDIANARIEAVQVENKLFK